MSVVLAGGGALVVARAAAPDAGKVAQLAYSDGQTINLVNADGSGRRRLTSGSAGIDVNPVWSPDGRWIAFVRAQRRGGEWQRAALFVVAARGGRPRRLTRLFAGMGAPAWAPDGLALVFTGQVSDQREALYSVSIRGGGARRLFLTQIPSGPEEMRWLPGGRVAFCLGYTHSAGAGVLEVATRRLAPVAGTDCPERGPFWSPDGRAFLAIRGDGRGNGQLLVFKHGGQRAWLTKDRPLDREIVFTDCCASWAPDGSKIVFESTLNDAGTPNLYVVNADGTVERQLTWGRYLNGSAPTLSGDAAWIAFNDDKGLFVIPAAGGRPRRISAPFGGWDWRPLSSTAFREPDLAPLARRPIRYIRVNRSSYDYYAPRVQHIRRVSNLGADLPIAVARNGTLLSFMDWTHQPHHRAAVGVIDLRSGHARILLRRTPRGYDLVGGFSPNGDRLLLASRHRLLTLDVHTGKRQLVAVGGDLASPSWLNDGRVAYLNHRRLMFVTPGDRPSIAFAAPAVSGAEPSWSPSGRYVVYARSCSLYLLDRTTGRQRRIINRPYRDEEPGYGPAQWAPDGRHFLLEQGSWFRHCTHWEPGPGGQLSVRDVNGTTLGTVIDGQANWSADSHALLVTTWPTGTNVQCDGSVFMFHLRTRKSVWLVGGRISGTALAGRNGHLIYPRYPLNCADGFTRSTADAHAFGVPALYLAQLEPRWR